MTLVDVLRDLELLPDLLAGQGDQHIEQTNWPIAHVALVNVATHRHGWQSLTRCRETLVRDGYWKGKYCTWLQFAYLHREMYLENFPGYFLRFWTVLHSNGFRHMSLFYCRQRRNKKLDLFTDWTKPTGSSGPWLSLLSLLLSSRAVLHVPASVAHPVSRDRVLVAFRVEFVHVPGLKIGR